MKMTNIENKDAAIQDSKSRNHNDAERIGEVCCEGEGGVCCPEVSEDRDVRWYGERVDYLAEFMTESRREVLGRTIDMRTRYMTILTENTFHPQNASALVRHCEAFGLQEMHTIEALCKFNPNANIVRGSDRWIELNTHSTTAEAISELKAAGYRVVATTPHNDECTPETFDVEKGKFVLVFGTEHEGVSREVVEAADEFLKIPMCGMIESLNVSASAAILIYILSERIRQSGENWNLSEQERAKILYKWMRMSVKDSDRILKRKFLTEF